MDFLGTLSNLDLKQNGVDLATNRYGESDLGKSICSASVQKKKYILRSKKNILRSPGDVLFPMKLVG